MMELNINNLYKVKLTEEGKKVLEKYCKRYLSIEFVNILLEKINKDKYYTDTLWNLCNIFGVYMMRDSNIKVFENDTIITEDFDLKNTDLIKFVLTESGKQIIQSHHPELTNEEFKEFFNILTDENGYINMRLYDFALYFKDNFYTDSFEPVIKYNSILVDKQVEIRVGDMVELTGWMNTRYNGLIAEVIGTGKSWGGMNTCKVKVKNTEGKFIEESVTIDMVKKVK